MTTVHTTLPWVKHFTVDNRDVLYFLEPDGDDNILHIIINEDGIFTDLKLTFNNDKNDKAQEAFDGIGEDDARRALAKRDQFFAEVEASAAAHADDDEDAEDE